MLPLLRRTGMGTDAVRRVFHTFNAAAPPFSEMGEADE
jgi:hypothetical protein